MGLFVPAGIYSGLLDALMTGGATRLEEFENASGEPRDEATTDLILGEHEATTESDEPPAPPFDKPEKKAESRRE